MARRVVAYQSFQLECREKPSVGTSPWVIERLRSNCTMAQFAGSVRMEARLLQRLDVVIRALRAEEEEFWIAVDFLLACCAGVHTSSFLVPLVPHLATASMNVVICA